MNTAATAATPASPLPPPPAVTVNLLCSSSLSPLLPPRLSSLFTSTLPSLPPGELLLILQNPFQSVPPLGDLPGPSSSGRCSRPWASQPS